MNEPAEAIRQAERAIVAATATVANARRAEDKFLCPYPGCGGVSCRLLYSRRADDRTSIRRRRECLTCGHRFNTEERATA